MDNKSFFMVTLLYITLMGAMYGWVSSARSAAHAQGVSDTYRAMAEAPDEVRGGCK